MNNGQAIAGKGCDAEESQEGVRQEKKNHTVGERLKEILEEIPR